MLLQFSVENFLSFDAMTTFSMRATDETDHTGHVLRRGKHQAVRGAALYGANAAGKSNLIKAMAYARGLIVSRSREIPSEPITFRFSEKMDQPSGFHWQWIYMGQKWSYGFDIQANHIIEEYLFAEPEQGGEEQLWFKRKVNESGILQVELGEQFLGDPESDDARLLKLIAPRTPSNELILHRCRDNAIRRINPVLEWFDKRIVIVPADSKYEPLVLQSSLDENFVEFLSQQLRDAGTGIISAVPARRSINVDEVIANELSHLSPQDLEELRSFFDALPESRIEYLRDPNSSIDDVWGVIRRSENGFILDSLHLLHPTKRFADIALFDINQESEGTQRYLHLLPRLYRLQTRPTVLIIDELERRLHTLLSRRFVEQSIGIADLPESQLIFTTHDTNLLDNTLLRRDEIWFVDKNENGASSLFSLAQFKDFDSPNYEQAYLMGLFEAIPYFRNSHQLSPALRKMDETTDS